MKKYAVILDSGECLSTIHTDQRFKWKSEEIRKLAGKSTWLQNGFYPANGMSGEVVEEFFNTLWGFNVYVLFIEKKFYVPMSEKGIRFVEETNTKSDSSINGKREIPNSTTELHERENIFKRITSLLNTKK
jgi:hypothetical protein